MKIYHTIRWEYGQTLCKDPIYFTYPNVHNLCYIISFQEILYREWLKDIYFGLFLERMIAKNCPSAQILKKSFETRQRSTRQSEEFLKSLYCIADPFWTSEKNKNSFYNFGDFIQYFTAKQTTFQKEWKFFLGGYKKVTSFRCMENANHQHLSTEITYHHDIAIPKESPNYNFQNENEFKQYIEDNSSNKEIPNKQCPILNCNSTAVFTSKRIWSNYTIITIVPTTNYAIPLVLTNQNNQYNLIGRVHYHHHHYWGHIKINNMTTFEFNSFGHYQCKITKNISSDIIMKEKNPTNYLIYKKQN